LSDASPEAAHASGSPTDGLAIPELVDLGQRLRRAREGRGIGLAELADRLHLAPEQLIALEDGDRLHLHEPVFVIAQAKRVAQALGVDVSEQVESLRHSRLMDIPPAAAAPPAPGLAPRAAPGPEDAGLAGPSSWGLAAAVAGLTLLLGVGIAQAIRQWGPRPQSSPPASTSHRGGGQPASPGVLLLRSAEPSWVEVRDADGQTLFSGLLEKEARFRLGQGLRVLAGRPDLVTVSIGGDAPRRLGTISEVEWQDFPPAAAAPATAPSPAPAP
jgi:cytoskeleton protein RodZ